MGNGIFDDLEIDFSDMLTNPQGLLSVFMRQQISCELFARLILLYAHGAL